MPRFPVSLTAIGLLLLFASATQAEPAPVAKWIPADAVVVLEVPQPRAFLEPALAPSVIELVQGLPAYQKAQGGKEFQDLQNARRYLERSLKLDWKTGLKKFFGGGVTISVHPKEAVLLVVECEDQAMLEQLHEIVRGFAQVDAAQKGESDRVKSKEYRGVTAWSFGPDEQHCVIGNRLVVANKPELLKAAIDLQQDGGSSLADVAEYQAARKSAGADAEAAAFVNLKILKMAPPVAQALSQDTEPGSSMVAAGLLDTLRESNWLAVGFSIDGPNLRLKVTTDGHAPETGVAAFSMPKKPGEGALPNLQVPRRMAAITLYRDLHGFYAAKDELFPERTSGLIFFENMMGIFFTGRDLTEEVLGELGPELRLVVAAQKYDSDVTPSVQVPGFALVFRLHNPDKFAVVVEEAWQKALGLVNFTRGQQAQPGLIIDRSEYGGTKYTVAYFSSTGEEDKQAADVRFNFRPTLARACDFMILSSTEQLARDLIDTVNKESSSGIKPLAGSHSLLELDGESISALLAANRDGLVKNNMIEKGHTRQEAEGEIDLLLSVVKFVDGIRFEVATREGRSEADLHVKLHLP